MMRDDEILQLHAGQVHVAVELLAGNEHLRRATVRHMFSALSGVAGSRCQMPDARCQMEWQPTTA